MPFHRGFSAWIISDGQVLKEHLVAIDADSNCVQCWIPSEAGKVRSSPNYLSVELDIDICRRSRYTGEITAVNRILVHTLSWMGIQLPVDFCVERALHLGRAYAVEMTQRDRSCSPKSGVMQTTESFKEETKKRV